MISRFDWTDCVSLMVLFNCNSLEHSPKSNDDVYNSNSYHFMAITVYFVFLDMDT